jgi:hypothetical protein
MLFLQLIDFFLYVTALCSVQGDAVSFFLSFKLFKIDGSRIAFLHRILLRRAFSIYPRNPQTVSLLTVASLSPSRALCISRGLLSEQPLLHSRLQSVPVQSSIIVTSKRQVFLRVQTRHELTLYTSLTSSQHSNTLEASLFVFGRLRDLVPTAMAMRKIWRSSSRFFEILRRGAMIVGLKAGRRSCWRPLWNWPVRIPALLIMHAWITPWFHTLIWTSMQSWVSTRSLFMPMIRCRFYKHGRWRAWGCLLGGIG